MKYSQNNRDCSSTTINRINDRLDEVEKEMENFKYYNELCSSPQGQYGIDLTGGLMYNSPCYYLGRMRAHAGAANHAMNRAVGLFTLC